MSITLVLSGPILATEKIFERKVLVYALNHLWIKMHLQVPKFCFEGFGFLLMFKINYHAEDCIFPEISVTEDELLASGALPGSD